MFSKLLEMWDWISKKQSGISVLRGPELKEEPSVV